MVQISEKLSECLSRAGWFAGRRSDPTDFVNAHTRAGFYVSNAAKDFFAEFSGLNISWSAVMRGKAVERNLNFCLPVGPDLPLPTFIQNFENRVGRFTPIISSPFFPFCFMMTPSQQVYAYMDCENAGSIIWGPWPNGLSALDALVNLENIKSWPVASGQGDVLMMPRKEAPRSDLEETVSRDDNDLMG